MHTRVQKCYLLKTVLCIAFQNMATVFSPLHDFNFDNFPLLLCLPLVLGIYVTNEHTNIFQ